MNYVSAGCVALALISASPVFAGSRSNSNAGNSNGSSSSTTSGKSGNVKTCCNIKSGHLVAASSNGCDKGKALVPATTEAECAALANPTPTPKPTATPTPTPATVDCVQSEWSPYGECSVACGGGTQERTRTMITEPAYGGQACGPSSEFQSCNTQVCPPRVFELTVDAVLQHPDGSVTDTSAMTPTRPYAFYNATGWTWFPVTHTMTQGTEEQINSANFTDNNVQLVFSKVIQDVQPDTTYRVDSRTQAVTSESTPGIHRIEIIYHVFPLTVDAVKVDASGIATSLSLDPYAPYEFYDNSRWQSIPVTGDVAQGGTESLQSFTFSDNNNYLNFSQSIPSIQPDTTYRVDAITAEVTQFSSPGINRVEVVYDVFPLTVDAVKLDENGNSISLETVPYAPYEFYDNSRWQSLPVTGDVPRGGVASLQSATFFDNNTTLNFSQNIPNMQRDTTYRVDSITHEVTQFSSPGANRIEIVYHMFPLTVEGVKLYSDGTVVPLPAGAALEFYDNIAWTYLPILGDVAQGGTTTLDGAQYGGYYFSKSIPNIQPGITYRVDATTGGTLEEIATPGVNRIEIVFEHLQIPTAPTSLNGHSPTNINTPEITVFGVTSGNEVAIFADSGCDITTLMGTQLAAGDSVTITSRVIVSDTTYYASQRSAKNGLWSACSAASFAVIYDYTAPELAIVSGPGPGNPIYQGDAAQFSINASDANRIVSLVCSLDGVPLIDCSNLNFTNLQEGSHTLTINATDDAGNTSTTSQTFDVLPQSTDCRIKSFASNAYRIPEGSSVDLNWSTANCSNVSIDQGIGAVNPPEGGTISTGGLYSSTMFTLSASASAGFNSLYHFSYSDGAYPYGSLTLSADGNRLYGMTSSGGDLGVGNIIGMNLDGSNFTNLYTFTYSDGAYPYGGLTLSRDGNTLYGMTSSGGDYGVGNVFSISTDGSNFTNLYTFTYSDGAYPYGSLTLSADGNRLYGMTSYGGDWGAGNIFSINTDGSDFNNLHTFTYSDGAYPNGDLTLSADGNRLYGMTSSGGDWGVGNIFSINTDGSDFNSFHTFTYSDGAIPYGGLTISRDGNKLYGMTSNGGDWGAGNVFGINTDGSDMTNLHTFTFSDGAYPYGSLTLSADGSRLFGNTYYGGENYYGTVFGIGTDGSNFNTIHSFDLYGGAYPLFGTPVLKGSTLYGFTYYGGNNYVGTIYSVGTGGGGGGIQAQLMVNVIAFPSISGLSPHPYYTMPGVEIAPIVPSIGPSVISVSIQPDITADTGLNFDPTTGTISGTPSTLFGPQYYTLTARNEFGQKAYAFMSLAVSENPPPPTALSGTSPTNNNQPAITVSGVMDGNEVIIYSDSSCDPSTVLGASAAVGDTAIVTSGPIAFDTTYYATQTIVSSGLISPCSFASFHQIYDNDPPALTITSAPPGNTITTDQSAYFTFSVYDRLGIQSLTCSLDGQPAQSCWGNVGYSGLSAGEHTLTLIAFDSTGNQSTVSQSFTVRPAIAPSSLTYTTPVTYNVGIGITPNSPSYEGDAPTSWSISPSLPSGLNFNLSNGVISGTPSGAGPTRDYTVTASNGGGSTTATVNLTVVTPVAPYSVQLADLNGDRILDMTNIDGYGLIRVSFGDGNGNFTPAGAYVTESEATAVAFGDFNADGAMDMTVAHYGPDKVSVYINHGDGTFADEVKYSTYDNATGEPSKPWGVASADFNGDGYADIVAGSCGGNSGHLYTSRLLLSNGDGTFSPATSVATGYRPCSVATMDVNHDGNQDILTANYFGHDLTISLGAGDGTFSSPSHISTGSGPNGMSLADLNHDGELDVVTANYTGSSIGVFLNNHSGSFSSQTISAGSRGPTVLRVADINGDGNQDIITGNHNEESMSVTLGNGGGGFGSLITFNVALVIGEFDTGDFNHDGKADIIAGFGPVHGVIIFYGTESGLPTTVRPE